MTWTDWIPHVAALLNGSIAVLLLAGFTAIRRGNRSLHPRLMLAATCVGVLFLICYVVQVSTRGHTRFPGDDWVRSAFLAVLASHTTLAVVSVPLVLRTLYLAWRGRLAAHRRLARIALPIWLYVSITGVVIYWMNSHLRPPVQPGPPL